MDRFYNSIMWGGKSLGNWNSRRAAGKGAGQSSTGGKGMRSEKRIWAESWGVRTWYYWASLTPAHDGYPEQCSYFLKHSAQPHTLTPWSCPVLTHCLGAAALQWSKASLKSTTHTSETEQMLFQSQTCSFIWAFMIQNWIWCAAESNGPVRAWDGPYLRASE